MNVKYEKICYKKYKNKIKYKIKYKNMEILMKNWFWGKCNKKYRWMDIEMIKVKKIKYKLKLVLKKEFRKEFVVLDWRFRKLERMFLYIKIRKKFE